MFLIFLYSISKKGGSKVICDFYGMASVCDSKQWQEI